MLFNSYEFILFFLPVTLAGYLLLRRIVEAHYALGWLVCCSLFFYGWWNPKYLFLITTSIVINYLVGLGILSLKHRNSVYLISAKSLLVLGIIFNLSLISYFKYANFFIDITNNLFGNTYHLASIILPIGISFFTFQQITYLVDTWRGETEEHSPLQYLLFFFGTKIRQA